MTKSFISVAILDVWQRRILLANNDFTLFVKKTECIKRQILISFQSIFVHFQAYLMTRTVLFRSISKLLGVVSDNNLDLKQSHRKSSYSFYPSFSYINSHILESMIACSPLAPVGVVNISKIGTPTESTTLSCRFRTAKVKGVILTKCSEVTKFCFIFYDNSNVSPIDSSQNYY